MRKMLITCDKCGKELKGDVYKLSPRRTDRESGEPKPISMVDMPALKQEMTEVEEKDLCGYCMYKMAGDIKEMIDGKKPKIQSESVIRVIKDIPENAYPLTMNLKPESVLHDLKIVRKSITSDETWDNADTGVVISNLDDIIAMCEYAIMRGFGTDIKSNMNIMPRMVSTDPENRMTEEEFNEMFPDGNDDFED